MLIKGVEHRIVIFMYTYIMLCIEDNAKIRGMGM
jgi:hypothetical protein